MSATTWEQEIGEALRSYIRDYCLPHGGEARLAGNENLFDSGILDSAGLIAFIVYLENKFEMTIPDEDLIPENFSTLECMANYMLRRKGSVSIQT
jgi:acyl carrier protein